MTILIKNAQVIDGTGVPAFKGDIFIRNKIIAEVGDLGRQSAEKIIPGAGLYAAPGFIDTATSSDHYLTLFSNPEQQDFLFQGVTTTLAGMCGASLSPLIYGELASLRKWGDTSEVNVNWHTVEEFFDMLQKRKLGVNFGTLIGHTTIRRALIGEAVRDLTEGELRVFERILLNSLQEGALGFSTDLEYAHTHGVPYREIKRLAGVLKDKSGAYAAHLRDEKTNLVSSVREVIKTAKETGIFSCITHMRSLKGFETDYEEALKLLQDNFGTADVYFTLFPFDVSRVPIYSFLPVWAKNGGIPAITAALENKSVCRKILKDLEILDWEEINIAFSHGHAYLQGKSLKEFADARAVSQPEGLLLLMRLTKLRAILSLKNINYPLTVKTLAHPQSLIGSSGASFLSGTQGRERRDTFPKFLYLSFKEKLMSLESAVKKITSLPAEKFHLKSRGLIKKGYFADVVLFSADTSGEIGIKHVFVNGQHAVSDNELLNGAGGTALENYID